MNKDFTVTPWEISGKVDYDKLIKQFGTQKIDTSLLNRIKKHTKELHPYLTRNIFFSHRDMNWLLDEYEKNNKFFLYTGRAPSGNIHLGHLVPWIFTKWLQDKFNVDLLFQFPDEEKVVFKKDLTFEDTEKFTRENMLDVIALGFSPKKTKFIIDTVHANLMYKHAMRVAKKITFSTVKATFGLTDQSNLGQIFYTSMQAVPAFLPSVIKNKNIPCLIPLAIDQDAHFRVSRDVMPKLGYYKPAIIHSTFLPSLLGPKGKMSASSSQDTIYTTDSPKTVELKIKKYAFSGGQPTITEHKQKGGNPDIDISYQYLKMLFEPDDKKLENIYQNYKSGSLLTSELKEIIIKKINFFLKKHQQKREQAKKNINKFILPT